MAAFNLADIFTPTSIGRLDHFLDDLDGTDPNRALQYNLEVLNQFGDVMDVRSGDEKPFLTAPQIAALINFTTVRRAALPDDLSLPAGHTLGRCTWRMRDGDGTNPSRSMYCRAVELDDAGQFVRVRVFDDQPNLNGAQVTATVNFLDAQRVKAETEILP